MGSSREQIGVYPQIGKVAYRRNARAKFLSIRVKATGEVRVTVPRTLSFSAAESFVLSKTGWIAEKLGEVEAQKPPAIQSGYRTRAHSVRFIAGNYGGITVRYNKPYIDVFHPTSVEVEHTGVQAAAKRAVELAYRLEAKAYLPERLKTLAALKGFSYSKLTIRNSTTRWGSCSAKNSISLSLYLMKLPDALIDYILLHELCHTVQKNHGPGFWQLLNAVTNGKAKQLANEVKRYSSKI